jgi:hypothetical protein
MKPRKAQQDFFHLPIVSGVEIDNLVQGQKTTALELLAALELLRLNAGSDRWQIKSIDVRKRYCLVVTDRTHAEITFGLDGIDKQLSKLNRLLDHLEPQHREIQTVNLQVRWNTPVTFVEPDTEVPPEVAKTASGAAKPVLSAPVKTEEKPKATSKKSEVTARSSGSGSSSRSGTSSSGRKSSSIKKKPFRLNE